ncbi:MAG: hypothetical protein Q7R41_03850 [Phycisphaerales bacterium]|nr:hypothetical protein [Phycisphaerales bacterium]
MSSDRTRGGSLIDPLPDGGQMMNRESLRWLIALVIVAAGVSVSASLLLGPSNIDPDHKFSWGENIGWMNWLDANGGADGVFVDSDFLSGYIWLENAGWLNTGDGNGPYGNSDDTDFGVNILPDGDLDGFAWGENIGWINFNTAGHAPNQARFDFAAGRFRGYAWGENIGWINLDDAVRFIGVIPLSPTPDTDNPVKSRFVSFSVATTQEVAIRVWLTSLHNVPGGYPNGSNLPIPYTLFEGQSMWVGPPLPYTESNSDPTTFMASKLQCTPYYQDWSTISLLHVTGEAILPSSSFDVENLAAFCRDNELACTAVSAPLPILTARSGNVVVSPPTDTLFSQANFGDISALVSKYQSKAGAPIKARSKIGTTNKRGLIAIAPPVDFTDIPVCVNAYQGKPYPYKPGKCSLAPTTECKDDGGCVGTGPCILCP